MSNHIPEEILVEILHRLPPKSILKCTSVCKSWRNLITHTSFISHHSSSPNLLLLQLCDERPHPTNPWPPRPTILFSLHHDDPFLSPSSSLSLPSTYHREFSIIGISHGLLCITTSQYSDSLFICNPSLRRYLTLPKPHDFPCLYFSSVGFGFDSRNQDYKVVRITCMVDDERFGLCAPHVELYSLSTGVWRDVSDSAPVCCLCCVERDAPYGLLNGVVHWGAKRRIGDGWWYFVLSFCFEDEVFREVVLPRGMACGNLDTVTVIGGGKDLSVYHVSGGWPCCGDIWVMKEYGFVESWNKVFSFNMRGFCLEAPLWGITVEGVTSPPFALCVRNSGEVLLLMDEVGKGCLYSLDVERKRLIDLQIGGEGYTWYLYSGYYKESLVLLNKASGMVSY